MTTNKIDKSELLSENELEQATGGFAQETMEDIGFLNMNCGTAFTSNYERDVNILAQNYASAGIRFRARNNHPNEYYNMYNGQRMSRASALETTINFEHGQGKHGVCG